MIEIKGLKNIRESFRTKQVRYGGYAVLITIAVIIGLIFLNLVVGQIPLQIDLTDGGLYSLTEQSLQVIDQIDSPVIFYGFWRSGDENIQLMEVINLYLNRSRNIRLEVLDPERNPNRVLRYDRENQGIPYGTLVVEGARGFRVIRPMDMYDFFQNQRGGQSLSGLSMERRITSALLFVAHGHTPIIYEITGHLQFTLAELGMQDMVERENFELRSINLVQSDIPADASSLILNSPRMDLTRAEADKLLDYLERGGRLLVMADYRMGELPMLNEVLASYGMRFDYGYLIENNNTYTAGTPVFVMPELLEHDITNPFIEQRLPLLLPLSMGVSETGARRRTVEIKPLFSSSRNSFLRTNIDDENFTQISSDITGPIILGMTAVDPNWIDPNNPSVPQTRIVAIGNASFLEFAQINPGNIDLFMNSITWLEDRPEALTVRSKSMYLLPLSVNTLQIIIFGILFVIVIPIGFFVYGLVIWLKRRHL